MGGVVAPGADTRGVAEACHVGEVVPADAEVLVPEGVQRDQLVQVRLGGFLGAVEDEVGVEVGLRSDRSMSESVVPHRMDAGKDCYQLARVVERRRNLQAEILRENIVIVPGLQHLKQRDVGGRREDEVRVHGLAAVGVVVNSIGGRGYDAEVGPRAADGPKEIPVLVIRCRDQLARGCDHADRDQSIEDQAVQTFKGSHAGSDRRADHVDAGGIPGF